MKGLILSYQSGYARDAPGVVLRCRTGPLVPIDRPSLSGSASGSPSGSWSRRFAESIGPRIAAASINPAAATTGDTVQQELFRMGETLRTVDREPKPRSRSGCATTRFRPRRMCPAGPLPAWESTGSGSRACKMGRSHSNLGPYYLKKAAALLRKSGAPADRLGGDL